MTEIRLDARPGAPARARAFADRVCGPTSGEGLLLAVSEMVTASVSTAGVETVELRLLERPDGTLIEVEPAPQPVPATLRILERIGGHWGVSGGRDGPLIWCVLSGGGGAAPPD